ncbi:MAG: hypothetical protein JO363_01340 [Solirubrobacterales bacterium]|nr:hypothetical protein [Solirubrobacterales bacterium]
METRARQTAEAAVALKQIADARATLAERLVSPWWYYPAAGAIVGGFVAQLALAGLWTVRVPVMLALMLAGGLWLPNAYRRATGFSGTRPPGPRARLWRIALVLVGVALFNEGLAVRGALGWVGPVLLGIVAVPVVIVVMHRYDAAVRAELRRGA